MSFLLFFSWLLGFFEMEVIRAKAFFEESVVWAAGTDQDKGIQRHFVYGLAEATDGSILGFAEGRIENTDHGAHHIVLKRSLDMGKTWLPTQVVINSNHGESFANPTPLVEKRSGTVFLFYARNYDNNYSEVMYTSSTDHGISWGEPVAVTGLFETDPLKRPFHLPGPGHGIQLKSGRMLLQVWHRFPVKLPVAERKYGVSVIYSDDQGVTWKSGGFTGYDERFSPNESRLVELYDGKVMLDSRFAASGLHRRIQHISVDQGLQWSGPVFGTLPPFTSVDAGLTTLSVKSNRYFLATRPADATTRRNLVVSLSTDEGKSWPVTRTISEGMVDYSDVITLSDDSILVLYGKGNPRGVVAARFNIAWVKGLK